ncbi:MAG: hypothetical protein KGI79_03615, partial [Patescibacteria group bacterium]|nr:hypothetical protein [Patescibacteria group bacterium]
MNPTISALEQRYPLSPRKFWKKLIPKIFGAAFASVVAGIIGGVIAAAIAQGDSDSFVVWFSTIAVSLLIVITVLNALYISAYIKRYYYSADEDFITIKKGVFAPTEIHVQYRKIQDV